MNLMKLSAISAVILGTAAASPNVFAHASYIGAGNGTATPTWLNGVPTLGVEAQDPGTGANMPTIGFAGIHGATTSNARLIETGVYMAAPVTTGLTTAQANALVSSTANTYLGGQFGNATTNNTVAGVYNQQFGAISTNTGGSIVPVVGNTFLGQLYKYNTVTAPTAPVDVSGSSITNAAAVMVSQGSLTTSQLTQIQGGNNSPIYNQAAAGTGNYNSNGFNTGLLYENPYAGSGTTYNTTTGTLGSAPNGEVNIIASTGAQYLNFAISPDANVSASNFLTTGATAGSNSGLDQLTYAIYQGIATGPGLQGLTLLGTGVATSVGGEVDFSVKMSGNYNAGGPQTGGEFTLVVGDGSNSSTVSNYDPYIKIAMFETGNSPGFTTNGSGSYATVYNEVGTTPASVPLPGAVWLFGSALSGMAALRRRKSVAA